MEDIRSRLRSLPGKETLRWVEQAVGAGARVDGMMILEGGGACAIHAIDVLDARGVRVPLVLKRFVRADWVSREPDLAEREARLMHGLEQLPLPVPAVVAVDPAGTSCDVPALLMTRLSGRVELEPNDLGSWLQRLAEPLPTIHAADEAIYGDLQDYRTYQDLTALEPPVWSQHPLVWQRAIDAVQRPRPAFELRLVHRDYHPTNLLFTQGRLSAVLDWTNASRGPSAIDPGHCRLNLAQLHGPEVAEEFLAIYEEISRERYDPVFDLLCLIEQLPEPSVYWGWRNLGVKHLDTELIRARLDDYAALLVAKL